MSFPMAVAHLPSLACKLVRRATFTSSIEAPRNYRKSFNKPTKDAHIFYFLSFKKHSKIHIFYWWKNNNTEIWPQSARGLLLLGLKKPFLSNETSIGDIVRERWASTRFHIWWTCEACWWACHSPLFFSRLYCHRTKSLRTSSTIL